MKKKMAMHFWGKVKSLVFGGWHLHSFLVTRDIYIHAHRKTQITTHIIMSEEEAATTTAANNRLRIETTLEATNAYAGPLDIDVGNLLVSETTSVLEREKFSLEHGVSYEERNENVRAHARDVLQRLVGDLFALPSESDVNGRFALLPPGTTKFPRSLPLPSLTKPKTKWEQFAEEKGIKKRKRSKMVFDEQQDEWKRRHGYDRANDSTKIAIVEAKLSSRAGETEDPFLKERKDKKARVEKNEMQRRRNLGEQVKTKGMEALPATLRLAIGNTNNNSNSNSKKGGGGSADRVGAKSLKSKQLVKDVQYKVATSTASVGKFNAPIPGDEKIKARGKRRSFASNTANTKSQEKAFVEKLIQREKMKKTSEGVDVGLAARKMQKEQEMEKREGKKQKLRGGGGGGKKKK